MISKERVVADNEIFSIPYRILKSENVFLVKMRTIYLKGDLLPPGTSIVIPRYPGAFLFDIK